jgi:GxxExxY protein
MTELIHEDLTFAIIGTAMEVHRQLGPGYLESIYQAAMEVELRQRAIPFESQKRIQIAYRGVLLGDHILDLVVDGRVIVELKAVKDLNDQHRAQLLSYLKGSGLSVGLLINFAKTSLEHKRAVLTDLP